MFNNNVRKGLKAWVRFDGNNNAVAGSLIFQKDKPKVGTWKEYKDVNLCCPQTDCTPDYGPWKLVTGGEAGDGVVLINNVDPEDCPVFTIVGPNDRESDGWVYLTRYYATQTCLEIDYEWTSFDDNGGEPPAYDWPVYWTSSSQPTGEPSDLTVRVNNTPADGQWNITVPAGQWFSIGIYSDDSCCGRGFLQVEICEVDCTVPANCIEFVVNTTADTYFEFSAQSFVQDYSYTITWGDGQSDTGSSGEGFISVNHTYANPNTEYTVRICFSDASVINQMNFPGFD